MQNEALNPAIENWVIQAFIDLGIDSTGPETDFFAGGGSSLTAIKLISKVDQEFGEYALPPVDLFERPTVAPRKAHQHENKHSHTVAAA